jgi:uncharacterized protein (TIGR03086 family)
MDDNLHRSLAESAVEAARVARGVSADQLGAPTPCTEFDARALINHWVAYTSHGLEHRARRTPLPEELHSRDFVAEPGWADAYAAQLDRAVAAWADPAAWQGEVDLGGMVVPAEQIAALLLAELVLHGWDVAKATGQELRCSQETAKVVLATVEESAEMYRQYDGFAKPAGVPDSPSDFDRALALSGRDPHWSPAAG